MRKKRLDPDRIRELRQLDVDGCTSSQLFMAFFFQNTQHLKMHSKVLEEQN